MEYKFGTCPRCGDYLQAAWFKDIEFYPKSATPTGRVRDAVDHLYCLNCGKVVCIDDSFDGLWHYEDRGENK